MLLPNEEGILAKRGTKVTVGDDGPEASSVGVPGRFHILTHAVMLDGWTFWAYDSIVGGSYEIAEAGDPDRSVEPLVRDDGCPGESGADEFVDSLVDG